MQSVTKLDHFEIEDPWETYIDLNSLKKEAFKILTDLDERERNIFNISFYAWPQTFGSKSGPIPGPGGALTDYTMFAFTDEYNCAVVVCCGRWMLVEEFKPGMHLKF